MTRNLPVVLVILLATACVEGPEAWQDQDVKTDVRQVPADTVRGDALLDKVSVEIRPEVLPEDAADVKRAPDLPDVSDVPDAVAPPDGSDVGSPPDMAKDLPIEPDVIDVVEIAGEEVQDAVSDQSIVDVVDLVPELPSPDLCVPDCDGKVCGDDGCGGECENTCNIMASEGCVDNQCVCTAAPGVVFDVVGLQNDPDYGHSIVLVDGQYLVGGETKLVGGDKWGFWVWRLWAGDGKTVCSQYLPGSNTDRIHDLIVDKFGSVIFAGTYAYKGSQPYYAKGREYVFARLQPDTTKCYINQDTIEHFGGDYDDAALDIEKHPLGGYVLAGYKGTGPAETDRDLWVAVVDDDGVLKSDAMQWGGAGHQEGHGVVVESDGFVVAGFSAESGTDDYNAVAVKMLPSGDVVWESVLGPGRAHGVVAADDGGYAVAGYEQSGETGRDFKLWLTDGQGEIVGGEVIAGIGMDQAHAIAKHPSGGFVLVGDTAMGSDDKQDGLIARFTASGGLAWKSQVGGSKLDSLRAVMVDEAGHIAVAGHQFHTTDGGKLTDMWAIKLKKECQ